MDLLLAWFLLDLIDRVEVYFRYLYLFFYFIFIEF